MSSTEYAAKITELKNAKNAISDLNNPLSECKIATTKGEKIVKELIICGEPMDKEKLSATSKTLSDISDDFDSIITDCNNLITKYEELYQQALATEEEARKKSTTSTESNEVN